MQRTRRDVLRGGVSAAGSKVFPLLAVVFSLLVMSACVIVDDPYHSGHVIYEGPYDDGYYYYDYYPDLDLYYDSRRGLYFYDEPYGRLGRKVLPRRYRHYRKHKRRRIRSRHAQPYKRGKRSGRKKKNSG